MTMVREKPSHCGTKSSEAPRKLARIAASPGVSIGPRSARSRASSVRSSWRSTSRVTIANTRAFARRCSSTRRRHDFAHAFSLAPGRQRRPCSNITACSSALPVVSSRWAQIVMPCTGDVVCSPASSSTVQSTRFAPDDVEGEGEADSSSGAGFGVFLHAVVATAAAAMPARRCVTRIHPAYLRFDVARGESRRASARVESRGDRAHARSNRHRAATRRIGCWGGGTIGPC
jgi:hypothetical protein